MAVIQIKPTSSGRRHMVKVTRDQLHKGDAYAPLLEPQFQKAGRNNNGHITVRHRGGGNRHHYRIVDFVRNKDGIPAKVERIEYDPNRTAYIALVCYVDGERRYIIAPRGLEVGSTILSGAEAPIRVGSTLPIRNIPVGSTIHCIELKPRQRCTNCTFCRYFGYPAGSRRHLCPSAYAFGRSAQDSHRVPCNHW